jgi:hypothetical protein
MRVKAAFICLLLILIAFGAGYGWAYLKLRSAETEWAATRGEMQSKISALEKELAQTKARETLRDISDLFTEILTDLREKNFGLAGKAADGMKEKFLALQGSLDEETKGKLSLLVPALEEIKKEAEALSPNAQKKTEEIQKQFNLLLKPPKKA